MDSRYLASGSLAWLILLAVRPGCPANDPKPRQDYASSGALAAVLEYGPVIFLRYFRRCARARYAAYWQRKAGKIDVHGERKWTGDRTTCLREAVRVFPRRHLRDGCGRQNPRRECP